MTYTELHGTIVSSPPYSSAQRCFMPSARIVNKTGPNLVNMSSMERATVGVIKRHDGSTDYVGKIVIKNYRGDVVVLDNLGHTMWYATDLQNIDIFKNGIFIEILPEGSKIEITV